MKKILGIGALALVGILVIGAVIALFAPQSVFAAYGRTQGISRGSATMDRLRLAPVEDTLPAGDLSASEVEALNMALQDEYKAWSVYDQIIADLGVTRPFTNIQKAEENHIAALVTLFDRYGVDVPANEWPGNVPTFDTLADACQAGVQAEIDNAALYDELLTMTDNAGIIQVFTNLQQASQARHLPILERCAP